jgi:hypothetical protein
MGRVFRLGIARHTVFGLGLVAELADRYSDVAILTKTRLADFFVSAG